MAKLKLNLPWSLTVFCAGLFFGLAVISADAHGGDTTLIHACVKNENGSLRIVSATATCGNNETALDTDAQGYRQGWGNWKR